MTTKIALTRPATLIAALLLTVCTAMALYRPYVAYDDWWYHLPFSARQWNIGGGAATFHLGPVLAERWLGFPKAWEWVQGLAWAATGSLYATIVPQLLLCAAFFAYAVRAHRIPLTWMVLAFFSSPMLFLHFQATYFDLPAAICIALGFFLLLDLLDGATNLSAPIPWTKAVAAIASIGLGGNIKYQSLVAGVTALAIVTALCLVTPAIPYRRRAGLIAVIVIAGLVASASALSNVHAYRNPFYPLKVVVHGATLFDGPEEPEVDAHYPTYRTIGPKEISLPGPLNFFLSATELDWTMRGVAPWYNLDSNTGQIAQRGAPSRTGGWGGLFIIANGLFLALQTYRLRRESDRRQRQLVIGVLLLLVATACFPRAHELRYWLYVPLLLIVVNLRYAFIHYRGGIVTGALIVLMSYGVAHTVVSPKSDLFIPRPLSVAALRAEVPPNVVRALSETGRYCDPNDDWIFRYSTALTGLPGLVSGDATDCPAAAP